MRKVIGSGGDKKMDRIEFLNLFPNKIQVLKIVDEDFVLKELYRLIVDFADVEDDSVREFLGALSEKLGLDVVNLVKENQAVVNKYIVDTEGKSLGDILHLYADKHTGELMWIGQVSEDGSKVELCVKNGVLSV